MNLRFWVCLSLATMALASCSSEYYMRRGNLIYDTGRFYKASGKYEKAYGKAKSKELQAKAAMRAGQCDENVNHLRDAFAWYKKAERANSELPDAYLKLAGISVLQGEFDVAGDYYSQYEELFADEKGKTGLYNLELLRNDMNAEGRYFIKLKKELNSRNNDFAPVYYPGDTCVVYFASTRKLPNQKRSKTEPVTGDNYSHIYISNFTQEIKTTDKNGKVSVKHFKEPRWLTPALVKDSLYSSRHEGVMCFDEVGNTLYFTSSRPFDKSINGTRIYKATKGKQDENTDKKGWTQLAPSGICGDSVSVGHPALTPDGKRMYFVTDQLPGGFGGKDIWYVEKDGGKWGDPVNAGDVINTAGDEMYPCVRDNGELYFASNGHPGFGGLDIYKVKETENGPQLNHLPAPLNSYADDFGITFKPGLEEGLLTSFRSGRYDDIYSFGFIPQQLSVRLLARNSVTDRPIGRMNVTVTCDDGSVTYLETDSTGTASMVVLPDREYVFVTENPDYLKGKGLVSTYRENADRSYNLTIDVQPIEKPIVIPNIYFDVAKWDLRPEAKENLNELLTVLKDNPNITIELSAHTDMVGNDQANLILSENRAKSVVDYLIEKGVYWDRLEAKGYGESQPREINEKDIKSHPEFKVGDILNERFVNQLKPEQKETAMQLNRRIEFKVLRTNYKPGPNSLHNPNQKAISAENGDVTVGKTMIKELKAVKGHFFTLQLGVFKNVPSVINQFRVVFSEPVKEGVRYCAGVYDTRKEAENAAAEWKKKGVDTLIREYNH